MNRREFMERMSPDPLVKFTQVGSRKMITDLLGGPEDPLRAILLAKIDREIEKSVPLVDRDRIRYSEYVNPPEGGFGPYTVIEWRLV